VSVRVSTPAPQDVQKAAPLVRVAPQLAQVCSNDVPQLAQKRASGGFSCPHEAQRMRLSNHVTALARVELGGGGRDVPPPPTGPIG
jgi:hypothetical protein